MDTRLIRHKRSQACNVANSASGQGTTPHRAFRADARQLAPVALGRPPAILRPRRDQRISGDRHSSRRSVIRSRRGRCRGATLRPAGGARRRDRDAARPSRRLRHPGDAGPCRAGHATRRPHHGAAAFRAAGFAEPSGMACGAASDPRRRRGRDRGRGDRAELPRRDAGHRPSPRRHPGRRLCRLDARARMRRPHLARRRQGHRSQARRSGGKLRPRRLRQSRHRAGCAGAAAAAIDAARGRGQHPGGVSHRLVRADPSCEAEAQRMGADPRRGRRRRPRRAADRALARRPRGGDGRLERQARAGASARRRHGARFPLASVCRRDQEIDRRRRRRAQFAGRRGDGGEPQGAEAVRPLRRARQARLRRQLAGGVAAVPPEPDLLRRRCRSAPHPAAAARQKAQPRADAPLRGRRVRAAALPGVRVGRDR